MAKAGKKYRNSAQKIDRIKKYNFDDIFDVLIFSHNYGMIKPNPKYFLLALDKLSVKPEQSLFIDDRVENIRCSQEIGIHSILFKNVDQLIEELRQRGIHVV